MLRDEVALLNPKDCSVQFPSVENVHRKYNTILGSSASIERGFSFGSIIFGKCCHRQVLRNN